MSDGILENWYKENVNESEFIVWGEIYDDSKNRFDDGAFIHTSGIKNREIKEGDTVETRNSLYVLGQQKTQEWGDELR